MSEPDVDPDLIQEEDSPDGVYMRYRKKIGEGSFKTVYLGMDTENGSQIAWNTVNLSKMSPDEVKRIMGETNILKRCEHKHIIEIYGVWEFPEKKQICFATELLLAGSLRRYFQTFRAKLKVIKRWCRQILSALVYLHSQKPPIIHRDLKCDNIFLHGPKGEVKIGDFGLSIEKTQSTSMVGTPEFIAPEIYNEHYSAKVDVYAFGMCVLEMVTHEYPYAECSNPYQIWRKVANSVPPRALHRIESKEIKAFIELCLLPEEIRPTACDLLHHSFLKDMGIADNKTPSVASVESVQGQTYIPELSFPQPDAGIATIVEETTDPEEDGESSDEEVARGPATPYPNVVVPPPSETSPSVSSPQSPSTRTVVPPVTGGDVSNLSPTTSTPTTAPAAGAGTTPDTSGVQAVNIQPTTTEVKVSPPAHNIGTSHPTTSLERDAAARGQHREGEDELPPPLPAVYTDRSESGVPRAQTTAQTTASVVRKAATIGAAMANNYKPGLGSDAKQVLPALSAGTGTGNGTRVSRPKTPSPHHGGVDPSTPVPTPSVPTPTVPTPVEADPTKDLNPSTSISVVKTELKIDENKSNASELVVVSVTELSNNRRLKITFAVMLQEQEDLNQLVQEMLEQSEELQLALSTNESKTGFIERVAKDISNQVSNWTRILDQRTHDQTDGLGSSQLHPNEDTPGDHLYCELNDLVVEADAKRRSTVTSRGTSPNHGNSTGGSETWTESESHVRELTDLVVEADAKRRSTVTSPGTSPTHSGSESNVREQSVRTTEQQKSAEQQKADEEARRLENQIMDFFQKSV